MKVNDYNRWVNTEGHKFASSNNLMRGDLELTKFGSEIMETVNKAAHETTKDSIYKSIGRHKDHKEQESLRRLYNFMCQ